MRHRTVLILGLLLLLARSVSADECFRGDLRPMLDAQSQNALSLLTGDWLKDGKMCRVGHFTVIGSAEEGNDTLILLRHGKLMFLSQPSTNWTFVDGNLTTGGKDGVMHTIVEADRPKVAVRDADNDGYFDELVYDIYFNGYRDSLSVRDSNIDGQLDVKIRASPDAATSTQFWVDGVWYRLHMEEGKSGVIVDGVVKPVESTPEGWKFKGE
jgi:hypothetical protein